MDNGGSAGLWEIGSAARERKTTDCMHHISGVRLGKTDFGRAPRRGGAYAPYDKWSRLAQLSADGVGYAEDCRCRSVSLCGRRVGWLGGGGA